MVAEAAAAWPEMVRTAFEALAAEFDPKGDGPVGLCMTIPDSERMWARPEARWTDPEMLYAGYLGNGRQVRIGYFDGAEIGPGVPGGMVEPELGSDTGSSCSRSRTP